mgnify:CR=1 FL=1
MNTSISEIVECLLKETDIPPRRLAEFHSWCAGEFSFLASQIEIVLAKKPTAWLLLRDESKSALEAERKWQMTLDGQREGSLRRQMKVLEKIMSSLRLRLMIKEQEAKQIF